MTLTPLVHAKAQNFVVVREGTLVRARVWKRPDLDAATGAALAEELAALLRALALFGRALVIDLRDAPELFGHRTQNALASALARWHSARCHIAIVVGKQAIQELQVRRLVDAAAPHSARLFADLDQARHWACSC